LVRSGAKAVSASATLDHADGGGPVGFVSGPFPGHLDGLPRRLPAFFDRTV
jgi:hypothetical protein